jgi:hypothetical protein
MSSSIFDRWSNLHRIVRWLLVATFLGLIGVISKQIAAIDFRAHAQGTGAVFKSADTVYYNGPLTESSVSEALTLIDGDLRINRLSINSGGGWPEPAKKLSDKILSRKLSIEVRDNCLSACLLFIFTAGNERSVTNGSALGFHFAPAFDYVLLKNKASAQELVRAKQIYDQFVQVLATKNADSNILTEQGEMLEPLCWRYQTNNLNEREAVVVYKYSLWFPNKEYFLSRNLRFDGTLLSDKDTSEKDVLATLAAANHLGTSQNERLTRLGGYLATNLGMDSDRISLCPAR